MQRPGRAPVQWQGAPLCRCSGAPWILRLSRGRFPGGPACDSQVFLLSSRSRGTPPRRCLFRGASPAWRPGHFPGPLQCRRARTPQNILIAESLDKSLNLRRATSRPCVGHTTSAEWASHHGIPVLCSRSCGALRPSCSLRDAPRRMLFCGPTFGSWCGSQRGLARWRL